VNVVKILGSHFLWFLRDPLRPLREAFRAHEIGPPGRDFWSKKCRLKPVDHEKPEGPIGLVVIVWPPQQIVVFAQKNPKQKVVLNAAFF
jgi:hypothetical protein